MNVQKVKLVYAKLEERVSQRTGKPYMTCGIKIEGEDFYRNSGEYIAVADKDKYTHLQAGAEVSLVLYTEPYNGQDQPKFKVPDNVDLMETRIVALENAVRSISARLNGGLTPAATAAKATPTPRPAFQAPVTNVGPAAPVLSGNLTTLAGQAPVPVYAPTPLVDDSMVTYDAAVDMFSDNLASHPDL